MGSYPAQREARHEPMSTPLMWAVAVALSVGLLYIAFMFLPVVPLPSTTASVSYAPDFVFFVGLSAQILNHWPPSSAGHPGALELRVVRLLLPRSPRRRSGNSHHCIQTGRPRADDPRDRAVNRLPSVVFLGGRRGPGWPPSAWSSCSDHSISPPMSVVETHSSSFSSFISGRSPTFAFGLTFLLGNPLVPGHPTSTVNNMEVAR